MASNQKENTTLKFFSISTFDIYNLNMASRKISSRRFEIQRQDYFSEVLIFNARLWTHRQHSRLTDHRRI